MTVASHEKNLILGSLQWPALLIPPLVVTHDKDLYLRFFVYTIVLALEPVVEPADSQPIDIQGSIRPEVEVADTSCPVRIVAGIVTLGPVPRNRVSSGLHECSTAGVVVKLPHKATEYLFLVDKMPASHTPCEVIN